MNEIVKMHRNTGTEAKPVWEQYFVETVASAVKMSASDETTVKEFVLQKIADLIGGAPEAMDTLKELADAIASNQTIMDALNAAIAGKAAANHTHTAASAAAAGFMSAADKTKLDSISPTSTDLAATAEKLKTAHNIGMTGAVTATPTAFDGSSDISIPILSLLATKLSGIVPIANLPKSTASAAGIVQLVDATSSADATKAATAHAVKLAYDKGVEGISNAATAKSAADSAKTAADTAIKAAQTAQTTADSKTAILFASALPTTAEAGTVCFLIG